MIILFRKHTSKENVRAAQAELARLGAAGKVLEGDDRVAISVTTFGPPLGKLAHDRLRELRGVEEVVVPESKTPRLDRARREITIGDRTQNAQVTLGGDAIHMAAGPCSVDEDITSAARATKQCGATLLRGGVWKTRTSPYAYAGGGIEALRALREAGDEFNLPIVVEVLDQQTVDAALDHVDLLQVGARNGQNHAFLRYVGNTKRPVLLKRHPGATISEWLLCAEHLLVAGCSDLILCERGIRTFENASRYTLDLAAIVIARASTPAPVFVDPSHPAGTRELVSPLALAAIAAGADGLLVEMHPEPGRARSDAAQALLPDQLSHLASQISSVAQAVGRRFSQTVTNDQDRSNRTERAEDSGHGGRPHSVLGVQAGDGPHVDGDVPDPRPDVRGRPG